MINKHKLNPLFKKAIQTLQKEWSDQNKPGKIPINQLVEMIVLWSNYSERKKQKLTIDQQELIYFIEVAERMRKR
jgi:hypothetical protein